MFFMCFWMRKAVACSCLVSISVSLAPPMPVCYREMADNPIESQSDGQVQHLSRSRWRYLREKASQANSPLPDRLRALLAAPLGGPFWPSAAVAGTRCRLQDITKQ
ncbi:hypothetical protein BD289DRAFT_440446 [Coniella lustricola]|uniref:Uncharacterized protein n=1 Tax=Coniella lustricola TaxID=2025994 RepID=A0A2T3A0J9_9PEZI|nr:hypothetical protein BD289DRAFT_440446 [Coniella lustricola]